MKFSEKFKLIESYLDDVRNFGDEDILLYENFFEKNKNLILENKGFEILLESATNKKEKEIAEDFKLYVEQL